MVYRYENERPITGPRMLDVCKFAERDFLAKSDENRFYVDDTDGIYLALWKDYDTPDEEYQFVSFESIVDYPEQNTSNIWGWGEFMRRFEQSSHGLQLMPMASGAVYSFKNGGEFWEYEFDVVELDDGLTGYPWPKPWTTGEPSKYAKYHPWQIERVCLFDVEYDFFATICEERLA